MIESQLNKIADAVPATNPGIPSQPEGLESANLVDMFDAGNYWSNPVVEVHNDLLLVKRGDPGHPIIPISIGIVTPQCYGCINHMHNMSIIIYSSIS